MAIRSFPFNSISGDRKYNATHWAEYFATFIGNGIFPNPSDNLQVMASSDMTVTLKAGMAWIDGHIMINDSDYILDIDPADGILDRKDRVVARWDALGREITPVVKKGELSSSPTAPSLQRDADAHELGLADISIVKGSIEVRQANIVDLRLNKNYCGIVHGLIEQVDTTTLFNQYQAWISDKKAEFDQDLISYKNANQQDLDNWYETTTEDFEDAFNTWFATIQGILDENVAANLLSMIEAIPRTYSGKTEPAEIRTGDMWLKEID